MAAKKTSRPKSLSSEKPEISHQLNALLQTMRCIAQHEDRLCTLLHALKTGSADDDPRVELRRVLDQLPAHEFEADLARLRASL